MDIRKITDENIEEYADIFEPDAITDIKREFYRGIALHEAGNDSANAAIIWELKNTEEDIDTEAELEYLYLGDASSGDKLFDAYKDEIAGDNVRKSYFEFENPEADVEKVTGKAGFDPKSKESRDIVVTVEELASLSFVKKQTVPYITAISELMVRQYRKGITNCLFHGRKGLLEDLAFLPMSYFDQDVSSCVQTDGKANGFLLVHKTSKDELIVDLLFAMEPDAKINLIHMLRYSINAAAEKYPPDTKVYLRRHNEMTVNIIKKLFPNKQGTTVLAGERGE